MLKDRDATGRVADTVVEHRSSVHAATVTLSLDIQHTAACTQQCCNSQQLPYKLGAHMVSPHHLPAMLCGKPPEWAAVAKSLFLILGMREMQKAPYAV